MPEEKRKNKKAGRKKMEPTERRTERLSAMVSPEIQIKIHAICEAKETSVSDLLTGLINEFLEKQQQGGEQ